MPGTSTRRSRKPKMARRVRRHSRRNGSRCGSSADRKPPMELRQALATGKHGRRRYRRRPDLLPYAFVAPIFVLLLAVSFYPSLYAVWLSMTNASLLRLRQAQFIGLDNLA